MNVIETERLILRHLAVNDAEFILELLNDPSFLQHIGDRGVRTLADARHYILQGPGASYEQNGFGLYLVELKVSQTPIGICGLVKREGLADVDIGYAFMPHFWSNGYAVESASAVMTYGKEQLGLRRIVAITAPDNIASIKVLEKIGLTFERMTQLSDDSQPVKLFSPPTPDLTRRSGGFSRNDDTRPGCSLDSPHIIPEHQLLEE